MNPCAVLPAQEIICEKQYDWVIEELKEFDEQKETWILKER